MKRVLSLILSVMMCVTVFAGCSFLEFDNERDMKQVIAVIEPITSSGTAEVRVESPDIAGAVYKTDNSGNKVRVDENGVELDSSDDGYESAYYVTLKDWSYTSPRKEIYKSQLAFYINSQGQSLIDQGYTGKEAVEYLLEQLINTELVVIAADQYFAAGEMHWTTDEVESIQRSVYADIDTAILAIYNQLLKENGHEEQLDVIVPEEEEASTTYPMMPQETPETDPEEFIYEGEESIDFVGWYTDVKEWYFYDKEKGDYSDAFYGNYPGFYLEAEFKSIMREAMRRFISQLKDNSENLIGVSEDDLNKVKEDLKRIDEISKKEGAEYVYPMLGSTTLVKVLYGDSYIRQTKIEKLEEYITESVSVTDAELTDYYNKKVAEQKARFEYESNYDTAVSNEELILYTPSSRYVFVKHILLPFSEEQTADLNRYSENHNEDEIEAYRAKLVDNMVVYPHKDGEDDLSKPTTVAKVMSEILAEMAPYKNSPYNAERKFNELIYKYNTDPGIFNNNSGYAVVYKLNEGESETYMEEFANAARRFRDDGYSVGQVLPEYAVTNYGVHIMYYASDPAAGSVKALNGYTTPGKYVSIANELRNEMLASQREQAFNSWTQKFVFSNTADHVTKYEDRVVSFYE